MSIERLLKPSTIAVFGGAQAQEISITFGLGAGALEARRASGSFFADSHTAHTNKVMVATLPYEVK